MPEMNFLQQFKNLFSDPHLEHVDHRHRILGLAGLINNADFVVYYRREAPKTKLIAGWNLPSDFLHNADDLHSHVALFLNDSAKAFEQVEQPQSYHLWSQDTLLKKRDKLCAIWLIDLGSHELGRGALALYFLSTPKRPQDGLASLQQCATILRFEEERRWFENQSKPYQNASKPVIEGVTLADATQPATPLIFVNPGFEKLTGYSSQEVIGRNCKFLQGSASDPDAIERLSHAIRNQQGIRVEILNYRKDHSEFWNLLSIQPVFNSQGQLIYFLGLQLDITHWRQQYLEPQRRNQAQSLQQQEQQQTTNQGLLMLDSEGVVVSAEDQVAKLFGYEGLHEITDHKLNHFIANMDEQTLKQQLEEQHQTSFPLAFFGKLGIRKNGEFFPISYTLHPLPQQDSNQIVALIQDLSQQQERAQVAQASQLTLLQSQQVKAQMLDDMSHTIRTKLHAMLSYARFGREKLPDNIDPNINDYLTNITVSGDQLLTYINHLLSLARIEAEPQLFRAMRQDISILMDDLINQFDRQLMQKKMSLDYEKKVKDTHAWIDNTSIRQILFQIMDKVVQNCKLGDSIKLQLAPGILRKDGSHLPALTLFIAPNLKDNKIDLVDLGNSDDTIEKHADIRLALSQSILMRYGGQLEIQTVDRQPRYMLRLPILPAM